MIHYRRGGRWHFINIFVMRGSLFPASFAMAAPVALISLLFKWHEVFPASSVLLSATVWTGFSSLVGFLVVFRTSEAYSRFWDGCTATHQMKAEWIDAASAIMAFCKHSQAPEDEVLRFKHLAVRLFSLLHAMALGEIEESEDLEGVMAFDLELIDPRGLDQESWRHLKKCHNKVTLVFTWLQSVIVENIKTGVLSIPPPILSRVFQELANGMVALHEAQKISNIPFPFPYAQTCDALLFMHWLITPIVTAQWTATWWAAAIFGFMQVFILWSLNSIAVEIEHPFGNDANDLNASQMQLDMNMSLLLVLHPGATRTPQLSPEAQIAGLERMGRQASQTIKKLASNSYNDVLSCGHAESGRPPWSPSEQDDFEGDSATGGDAGEGAARPLEADTGRVMDSHSMPLVHMDPACSPPVSLTLHGDQDPAPALGTPRSPRRGSAWAQQPPVQAAPVPMDFGTAQARASHGPRRHPEDAPGVRALGADDGRRGPLQAAGGHAAPIQVAPGRPPGAAAPAPTARV